MIELEAINYCLRWAGREPAADPSSLTEAAANAQSTLKRVRQEVLETGYRFNTREITLSVDATSGRVPVSAAYLAVVLPTNLISQVDTVDGVLYVWNESTDTWHTEQITNVKVIFDIEDFLNLPHKFAVWIARQGALEYWIEVNAGKQAPLGINEAAQDARQRALNSEPPVNIRGRTGWEGRLDHFGRSPVDSPHTPFSPSGA